MDYLSCFDDYYLLDFDDSQDTEFFYWDISNDTVIPYIVGMTPDRFKKFFQTIYGDYKIFVHIYGIYILQCSALFSCKKQWQRKCVSIHRGHSVFPILIPLCFYSFFPFRSLYALPRRSLQNRMVWRYGCLLIPNRD